MSQDQPPPSKPDQSTSQPWQEEVVESSRPAYQRRSTSLPQMRQLLQRRWQLLRPVLKAQTIRALRLVIQTLERAMKRLEAEAPPRLQETSPADQRQSVQGNTLVAAPEITVAPRQDGAIASASGTIPPEDFDDIWSTPLEPFAEEDAWDTPPPRPPEIFDNAWDLPSRPANPVPKPVAERSSPRPLSPSPFPFSAAAANFIADAIVKIRPILEKRWEQARPTLDRMQAWWQMALRTIRSLLPPGLNQALSDQALTGAIAGILLLLWIGSGLLSGEPAHGSQAPVVQSSPASPSLSHPTAPAVSTPIPGSTPRVIASPPSLNLTPEQSLIAAIQDQVTEVTNHYSDGLIQSIQANFRSSRLIVKVGSTWYEMAQIRQDTLANEMLNRSKELDFSTLEITDTDGLLLARSPVVGETMVILQRKEGERGG